MVKNSFNFYNYARAASFYLPIDEKMTNFSEECDFCYRRSMQSSKLTILKKLYLFFARNKVTLYASVDLHKANHVRFIDEILSIPTLKHARNVNPIVHVNIRSIFLRQNKISMSQGLKSVLHINHIPV